MQTLFILNTCCNKQQPATPPCIWQDMWALVLICNILTPFAVSAKDATMPVTTATTVNLEVTHPDEFTTRRNPLAQEPVLMFAEVLAAPQPFSDIGIVCDMHYPATATLLMQVRTSVDGHQWSDWQLVSVDESPNPIQQQADGYLHSEFYADLIHVAAAPHQYVELQLEVTGDAQGRLPRINALELHFINAGHTPPTQLAELQHHQPYPEQQSTNTRSAHYPKPLVIARSDWGADETISTWHPDYTDVTHVIIHHTAGSNHLTDWPARVRSIHYYHAVTHGWGDIGYHYLIDPNGLIYAGRQGGDGVIGAHAGRNPVTGHNYNWHTLGVALLGTFSEQLPTPAALNALNELLAWKSARRNLNPLGQSLWHDTMSLHTIAGHRDVKSTACPGAMLYAHLPTIRQQTAQLLADHSPPDCIIDPATNHCLPVVTQITPATAIFAQPTTFTVQGHYFTSEMAFFIANCADLSKAHYDSTQWTFSCTPQYTTGMQAGIIKTRSGGQPLFHFQLQVETSTPPHPLYNPEVYSVSPLIATLSEPTTFTVIGQYLPESTAFFIGECSYLQALGGTEQQRQFRCTPSYTTGLKQGLVKDQTGGNTLKTFSVDFELGIPTVTTVTPTQVSLWQPTVFTVHGKHLSADTAFYIPECAGAVMLHHQPQEMTFQCTPSYTAGVKQGIVKDRSGGTVLKVFTITVQ